MWQLAILAAALGADSQAPVPTSQQEPSPESAAAAAIAGWEEDRGIGVHPELRRQIVQDYARTSLMLGQSRGLTNQQATEVAPGVVAIYLDARTERRAHGWSLEGIINNVYGWLPRWPSWRARPASGILVMSYSGSLRPQRLRIREEPVNPAITRFIVPEGSVSYWAEAGSRILCRGAVTVHSGLQAEARC